MRRKSEQLPLRASELQQEHKDEFIRLIYDGHRPDTAAEAIGSTATMFRRIRNPKAAHYDAAFTRQFRTAIGSAEHNTNFLERIRGLQWQAAEQGNARIIEKLSLIHDPDWEPLRHANLHVDINLIARMLPNLTDEELARVIEAAEKEHVAAPAPLRALEAGK